MHKTTDTSSADIAAQGAGGTPKGSEEVEEGVQKRVHTEVEEREQEKEGEIHADEERSRHPERQGLCTRKGQILCNN